MKDISAREQFVNHVCDLKEEIVLNLVKQRIADGENPLNIIEDCQKGLLLVGELYEDGTYFISGLIMAGEIMKQVMNIIQPELGQYVDSCTKGTVILGTVEGDIHDLGKNMLSFLLACRGFTIHDLGVDVPPTTFLQVVKEIKPDIVGLSGLLTFSYDKMKETVTLLNEDTVTRDTPIVIGGSQTSAQVARMVGTSLWCNNAIEGVQIFERLVSEKNSNNLSNEDV